MFNSKSPWHVFKMQSRTTSAERNNRAHIWPHRGGWQGAIQDSWWKPGALWLLGAADSGGICASCCSAIRKTLKVNYNINDRPLQAVVPYYTSIIPCMGTQRHREGIAFAPAAALNSRTKNEGEQHFPPVYHVTTWQSAADWMTDSLSLHFHPSLHFSSEQPPTSDPHPSPPPCTKAAIPNNICLILPPSTAEWNQSGRDVMCEERWLAERITCIWERGARALRLPASQTQQRVAGACLIGITQTSPSCHPSLHFQ